MHRTLRTLKPLSLTTSMAELGKFCLFSNVYTYRPSKFIPSCYSTVSKVGNGDRDINVIKSFLQKFPGGEISFTKCGSDSDIGVLSISHPERRNAFSGMHHLGGRNAFVGSMCVALHDQINKLKDWKEGKALAIRGLGGMFCSGADLTMARAIADSSSGEMFSHFMQSTLMSLRNLHLPTIALIQGNVVGGGAEVMLACDIVMAAPGTRIAFVQGQMGIVPGWAGATHLVQRVGYHKALNILLACKKLESVEALNTGLIDYILESSEVHSGNSYSMGFDDHGLLQAGLSKIEKTIHTLSADVIQGIKLVCQNASVMPYHESVANENAVFKTLWGAEANIKALHKNV